MSRRPATLPGMIDDIVKELRLLGRDGLAVRLEQSAAAVEASHSAEVLELTSQLEAAEEHAGELETANTELTSQLEVAKADHAETDLRLARMELELRATQSNVLELQASKAPTPDATAPSPTPAPAAEAPAVIVPPAPAVTP